MYLAEKELTFIKDRLGTEHFTYIISLSPTATLGGKFHYSNFPDEKTEAQRQEVIFSKARGWLVSKPLKPTLVLGLGGNTSLKITG